MKSIFYILFFAFISSLSVRAQDKSSCKVALVQLLLVWGDVNANLSAFEKRVRQCKGCDLIVFPELFTSGCEMKKKDKAEAIRIKDEIASHYPAIIRKMQKWAAKSKALIIGSTIYKEEGKYYNRLLAVFPNGDCQYYDKHNCFNKGSFSPGYKQLVISWKRHRFATYICYDLRFPEWSRNSGQYDTAIYIANWPESRSTDWKDLLRERAIENKAHVIAVNCAGTDLAGITYAGESCFLLPDGQAKAICEDYADDIVIVEY